jgi:antiviral helicase SKI2
MIRQSPITLPLPPLRLAPLPATHNVLPLSRGIEGEFSRWREAIAPKPPAHPALSSSTTRAPGSSKNFVRGKGSYAPFLPGGLDEKDDLIPGVEEEEEEVEEEDGWKTRAPGLKRGVQLSGGKLMIHGK